MKNLSESLCMCRRLLSVTAILLSLCSCNLLGESSLKEGTLRVCFAPDQEILTRSGIEIPDTSDFILTVKNSKGTVIYEGAFGDSPETMSLNPGSYTVSIISEEFRTPAFSSPQFGDEQCVVVSSGTLTQVRLLCTQINSGIRLKSIPDFWINTRMAHSCSNHLSENFYIHIQRKGWHISRLAIFR